MTRIVFTAHPVDLTAYGDVKAQIVPDLLINTPEYAEKHARRQAAINTQIEELTFRLNALPADSVHRKAIEQRIWEVNRLRGISGTAAAAVLGVNPYQTAWQYWRYATFADIPADISNPATEWGQLKEPVIAQKYLDTHRAYAIVPPSIASELFPFMTASADRIVMDSNGSPDRILEIKTASFNREYESEQGKERQWGPGNVYIEAKDADGRPYLHCTETDSTVPAAYIAQVMHYMAASGIYKADIAVLIGHCDYREYSFTLDPEQAIELIKAEDEFYCRHILDGVEPPRKAIDLAHIKPVKSAQIEATEQVFNLASTLRDVKAQMDELKAREAELREQLVEYIGTNETLTYNGSTVLTYGARERAGTFDAKRFEVEHPDLFAQYKGEKTFSRVFSLKLK